MRRFAVAVASVALGALGMAAPARAASVNVGLPHATGDLIAVADQADSIDKYPDGRPANEVLIFRQGAYASGTLKNSAVVWRWKAPETTAWTHLSDVKFRTDSNGVRVVLVTASGGNVASINYATHRIIWQAHPGGNPHAIELLPNGAVAVADSTGHIYYYPYGWHRWSERISLDGAHGVLYNDGRLWALGGHQLNQYDIHRTYLKKYSGSITGFSGGHDLSPIYGTRLHQMWLGGHGVYTFNKYANPPRPVRVPGGENNGCVKAIGNQRDGILVEEVGYNCHGSNGPYWNDKIYLFDRYGNNRIEKVRPGARFYKARPVSWLRY
jgi:Family of unknown function (DUF6528)